MKPRVLIIEDNPADQLRLEHVVSATGAVSVSASSLAEAKLILSDNTFAVALVDIQLNPYIGDNRDGEEIIEILEKNNDGTLALVISAVVDIHDYQETLKMMKNTCIKNTSIVELKSPVFSKSNSDDALIKILSIALSASKGRHATASSSIEQMLYSAWPITNSPDQWLSYFSKSLAVNTAGLLNCLNAGVAPHIPIIGSGPIRPDRVISDRALCLDYWSKYNGYSMVTWIQAINKDEREQPVSRSIISHLNALDVTIDEIITNESWGELHMMSVRTCNSSKDYKSH